MVQCFGWLGRCGLVLEEFCEPNVMLVYMINYSFSLFFTNVGFYVCKLPQYQRFGLSDSLLCYMTTVFFFFPMFTSFVLVDNMSPPQKTLHQNPIFSFSWHPPFYLHHTTSCTRTTSPACASKLGLSVLELVTHSTAIQTLNTHGPWQAWLPRPIIKKMIVSDFTLLPNIIALHAIVDHIAIHMSLTRPDPYVLLLAHKILMESK